MKRREGVERFLWRAPWGHLVEERGCCRIGLEGGVTYQPGEDAAKAREDWREGGKLVSQVTLCQQVSRRFIIGTGCHPCLILISLRQKSTMLYYLSIGRGRKPRDPSRWVPRAG